MRRPIALMVQHPPSGDRDFCLCRHAARAGSSQSCEAPRPQSGRGFTRLLSIPALSHPCPSNPRTLGGSSEGGVVDGYGLEITRIWKTGNYNTGGITPCVHGISYRYANHIGTQVRMHIVSYTDCHSHLAAFICEPQSSTVVHSCLLADSQ